MGRLDQEDGGWVSGFFEIILTVHRIWHIIIL
jgi:hypothetical protein